MKSWVVVRGSAQRPLLAVMPGTQAVQPVHRDVPTYGPAPRKTENGDRVTGLQQSPLCIREEAKFITAHYGVQQMS